MNYKSIQIAFSILNMLCFAFLLSSCGSSTDNESNSAPKQFIHKIKDNEEVPDSWNDSRDDAIEQFITIVEPQPDDPNDEIVCTYCYSITQKDLEACDSCGMTPKEGTYSLSHEELQTLNTTLCRSCSQIIPELAKTCKFCTTFQ